MSDAERSEPETEPEWVRRRRVAAVFGDVLPDRTSDELSPEESAGGGTGTAKSGRREGKGDEWYRDQVPPHHG